MYLVFRCDCGRVLYCSDRYKSHKCGVCGKVLKVKSRRVLHRTMDVDVARLCVSELQDELFHNTGFVSADKLKK